MELQRLHLTSKILNKFIQEINFEALKQILQKYSKESYKVSTIPSKVSSTLFVFFFKYFLFQF